MTIYFLGENPEMPHPVDLYVGARVRSLRVLRGVSQTELAQKIGNSFQQVQKYETGSNRISASKLHSISKILDVQPNYFFEGVDDEKPETAKTNASLRAVRVGAYFENIPSLEVKERLYSLIKAMASANRSTG